MVALARQKKLKGIRFLAYLREPEGISLSANKLNK
jgi:hypothetical protein